MWIRVVLCAYLVDGGPTFTSDRLPQWPVIVAHLILGRLFGWQIHTGTENMSL